MRQGRRDHHAGDEGQERDQVRRGGIDGSSAGLAPAVAKKGSRRVERHQPQRDGIEGQPTGLGVKSSGRDLG